MADGDLLQQAACGSSTAQLGMVDLALAAGASGEVRQVEALFAAETWARLAAAGGGKSENHALAAVLLERAQFEQCRGADYNANWYEGEARRVLRLLVALDDADAVKALAELGPSAEQHHHEPDPRMLANLIRASHGDTAALGALCDESLRLFYEGASDPIEALTAGELYARLGSATGDADHLRRLAGVLLKRAEYEYREGWSALADNVVAEAAVLLSILVDTGDHSMATWLNMLVNESAMPAIAAAVRYRPSILKFIEPWGTC